jgi:hypothetical protein
VEDVFVRKLPAIALAGVAAATLAGTAVAANRNSHVMNVSLPDGSVAHVEYTGDIAPKVTVDPARPFAAGFGDWAPLPSLAGFDRMIAQMNRETEAMMRQAQQMARQPVGGAVPYVASFGNAPAGVTSTTIVSYSNGNSTCTRTTETVSQGPGKPPKVTSSVSGNCAADPAPGQPAPSSAPINRT